MTRSSTSCPSERSRAARRSGTRGVAAVEFALILPFFLTLVLGLIDYGYYFFVNLTVTNAAREGAREGAIQTNTGDAGTEAKSAAEKYLVPAGLKAGGLNTASISITPPVDGVTDSPVVVTVSIDTFNPLVGFLPTNLYPQELSVTSQMRWEMSP